MDLTIYEGEVYGDRKDDEYELVLDWLKNNRLVLNDGDAIKIAVDYK